MSQKRQVFWICSLKGADGSVHVKPRRDQNQILAAKSFDKWERLLSISIGGVRPPFKIDVFFVNFPIKSPEWRDLRKRDLRMNARNDKPSNLPAREHVHALTNPTGPPREDYATISVLSFMPRIHIVRRHMLELTIQKTNKNQTQKGCYIKRFARKKIPICEPQLQSQPVRLLEEQPRRPWNALVDLI